MFVRLALSCCFADIPNQGVVFRHLLALLEVVAGHPDISLFTRGSGPAATWQHSGLRYHFHIWKGLFAVSEFAVVLPSLQVNSEI